MVHVEEHAARDDAKDFEVTQLTLGSADGAVHRAADDEGEVCRDDARVVVVELAAEARVPRVEHRQGV